MIGEAEVALRNARRETRWKLGKDVKHLEKRKAMGHLPEEYSLEKFTGLIQKLLWEEVNEVYVYKFGQERYYFVRGMVGEEEWIVILSKEGVIETAFPPYDIEDYLRKRRVEPLGRVGEILKE